MRTSRRMRKQNRRKYTRDEVQIDGPYYRTNKRRLFGDPENSKTNAAAAVAGVVVVAARNAGETRKAGPAPTSIDTAQRR